MLEWLWSLLPDTCETKDCCRKGVRGNENRVYPFDHAPEFYIVMCDYCSSKYERGEIVRVEGLRTMVISKSSKFIELAQYRRRRNIERSLKEQTQSG